MIVNCPSCGQANRLPQVAAGKRAVCAKCKSPLTGVVALTDATFRDAIAGNAAVVDFWAAWCGPCRTIAPLIEELAREHPQVRFGKLNVDENPTTAAQFQVQSIPLLVFFRGSTEAGRLVGAHPKHNIESAIRQYLGA